MGKVVLNYVKSLTKKLCLLLNLNLLRQRVLDIDWFLNQLDIYIPLTNLEFKGLNFELG